MQISLALSITNPLITGGGVPVVQTVLRREANGTVTVVSLASAWVASLTREGNGTVTVSG